MFLRKLSYWDHLGGIKAQDLKMSTNPEPQNMTRAAVSIVYKMLNKLVVLRL